MKYYLGIDPGKNGGIALQIINDGMVCDSLLVLPYSEDNIIHIMNTYDMTKCICVLEKVNAMPGQGVVSMFHFGENFGFIQGVLKSFEVAYELVPPQKWKKEFSVTSDKNTSIEVAKRLFPGVSLFATQRSRKEHDGMAEALLMSEYARRKL